MPFLDFLQQSPYGSAQGPMPTTGAAGVPQGPTWGQILNAAAIGGSRAGVATGLAPLVNGQQGTPIPGQQMLQIGPQKKQQDSTQMITALLNIFGL